jgi:hypothetical protein
MIITKMALPRRTFLRGLGATLALPLLDAMVPALSATARTAANPVCRLGFVYIPNGVAMNDTLNEWRPIGEGANFELSPILRPLAPFRDRMVVVSGLAHPQAEALGDGNGEHPRAGVTWLNGVHPKKTEGADIRCGITADQIAATTLGAETALPSLELIASEFNALGGQCSGGYSCVYLNTISWSSPTTPLPVENNPSVVFERLFGDGGSADERIARLQKKRSILDWVNEDLSQLSRVLGPGDRVRVSNYLDAVREVERRIQRAEAQQSGSASLPVPDRPTGIPGQFDEHLKLLFDLQWLAYQADLTRVFTLMYGRELDNRTYPEIGINEPHHGLSHHGDKPEQFSKFAKTNEYHTALFGYFLEKLRSTADGDGTLLDNTMLVFGSGLGNGNEHRHTDLPALLAGGGAGRLKGGRHLAFPAKDATPMTNLLVSVLDKAGVAVDRLGDSTGKIDLDMMPDTLSGL